MGTDTKVKPFKPLLIFIVIAIGLWWLINTFNTGNPLWFSPVQPTFVPNRFVVWNYGTAVTILPGSAAYNTLNTALNQSLADFRNRSLADIGLGDETLRRYQEQELVLEIYYSEDITFNTLVRMTKINQLLIPIDATHAGQGYLFLGSHGEWRVGAMVMSNEQPLQDALRQLGYLK